MHAQTLPAMLMDQAARQGARAWVQAPGGTLEYGEAPAHAARWAALLAAHGVRRGDRVALMAGNRIEFLSVVLGCGWLGAVAVPINTASRGMQLRHILENSACVLLVADAASCAGLATVDGDGLALREIWLLDGDAPPAGAGAARAGRVAPAAPPEGVEPADLGPGDMLAILYTSGTSGLSKGVCCPHAQFWWWGLIAARNLEIRGEDVLYTSLPLFHTNALNACFQALVTGASIVCDERFSVSRYFDRRADRRHGDLPAGRDGAHAAGAREPRRPNAATARAHRWRRACRALSRRIPAPHRIGAAGRLRLHRDQFRAGRGAGRAAPGTMGRVAPEFEACVADEHDAPVPDGQPGELLLRARRRHAIATGYFAHGGQDGRGLAQPVVPHRVVRDADGYFLDRMKDAIRRRGENISSYEVEQVLLAHPAIAAVAVYAVQSELAEDEVMAALVYKPGSKVAHAELLDFCQPRMPYFAVPRYLRALDELPRTGNGKIRKFKLRDEGVTADTWDRDKAGYKVSR